MLVAGDGRGSRATASAVSGQRTGHARSDADGGDRASGDRVADYPRRSKPGRSDLDALEPASRTRSPARTLFVAATGRALREALEDLPHSCLCGAAGSGVGRIGDRAARRRASVRQRDDVAIVEPDRRRWQPPRKIRISRGASQSRTADAAWRFLHGAPSTIARRRVTVR